MYYPMDQAIAHDLHTQRERNLEFENRLALRLAATTGRTARQHRH